MVDPKRVIELVDQKRDEIMPLVAKLMPEPLDLTKLTNEEHAKLMEQRFREEEAALLETQGLSGGADDFRLLMKSEPEGAKELRRYYKTRGLDLDTFNEQVKELK